MAKFYKGQRGRVVADDGTAPDAVGKTGRVIGFDAFCECYITGRIYPGYSVELDGMRDGGDEWEYCFEAHELEPILPEGAAPSEFATLADLLASIGSEMTV